MTKMMFTKVTFRRVQIPILQNRSLPHVALIPALAYLLYVAISIVQASGNPEQLPNLTIESEQLDQEKPKKTNGFSGYQRLAFVWATFSHSRSK